MRETEEGDRVIEVEGGGKEGGRVEWRCLVSERFGILPGWSGCDWTRTEVR